MSCNYVFMRDGKKMIRPITNREEYINLRNSQQQQSLVAAARNGDERAKRSLVQMNYSLTCPTPLCPSGISPEGEAFPLRGATALGNSVGMDVDHLPAEQLSTIAETIISKMDELGLLMLEKSARGNGYHVVFKRHPELTNEENLMWASELLGIEYDKGAKDITRVFYTTTANEEDLLYLDDALFGTSGTPSQPPRGEVCIPSNGQQECCSNHHETVTTHESDVNSLPREGRGGVAGDVLSSPRGGQEGVSYLGIPYEDIITKWWQMYNDGAEPVKSNRDVLTFELAVNMRHICGFDRDLMAQVIPCYDGFPEVQKMKCIDSALAEKRTQMPKRLKDLLLEIRQEQLQKKAIYGGDNGSEGASDLVLDDVFAADDLFYANSLPAMPMGVSDSIDAVGPTLAMPAIVAICPAIGALATGVVLDVHGKKRNINLISYIAGDFASGKGNIDPIIDAWMHETKALDKMYQQQEEEWRAKKRAAKNKKEQPEEPKLPVRCLTLNNTVANLAERLANTEGKHAFSFTPEADTVAQKWKNSMSDFSVMLRQSYDGTGYEREARSVDAVNVHIDHLLWNVTMCGTPDALYRVVSNYTDGFQSRIAVARTPDNTFASLEDCNFVLTAEQEQRILQVSHLLPFMSGEIVLPKLEGHGRAWLEYIRLETMKDDDKIKARQRFRVCVTAQRMTCCLMLCRVCEQLLAKYGLYGAETRLKQNPNLWKEMLLEAQTDEFLGTYDVIADYLLDSALFFFRSRIEDAFNSKKYAGSTLEVRSRRGKNDSIFERLDFNFTFEQALQHSVAVKGAQVTRNQVQQMLKNWGKQGLVCMAQDGHFHKL